MVSNAILPLQEYHARISEDSRWPSPVVRVEAHDADTGHFGEVRYSLSGEAVLLFVINDTTGEVRHQLGHRIVTLDLHQL